MYRAPRGTSDILPQEQAYWRYVEQKVVDICLLYGYERLDVPTFEATQLFARSVGEATDIVTKEMYSFTDRGGNQLTLRPEVTASACRAYLEHGWHNLPQPVKLYSLAPVFRYERPQAGRYREHHQFNYEALGEAAPILDAEVIDMAWQFYKSLKLQNLSLQLNSIGCKQCRPQYLVALKDYYAGYARDLCSDCKTRLNRNPLRLLDCKQPMCQKVADSAPRSHQYLCPECAEHFSQLKSYLKLLELPFEINHRLVRGLDYYTKTVFEVQTEEEGAQSTLGGGGRYDDLIEELGGKPTPSIGLATGLERIVLNLKKQNIPIPPLPRPQVFIAYIGDEARDKATELTSSLRRADIAVIEAIGSKSLKAQLRQANTLGVRQTVIIGEEEVKTGTVILREMTTSQQQTVPLTRLEGKLR